MYSDRLGLFQTLPLVSKTEMHLFLLRRMWPILSSNVLLALQPQPTHQALNRIIMLAVTATVTLEIGKANSSEV